jgi:tetratricopeptide (TPR) repeat protein
MLVKKISALIILIFFVSCDADKNIDSKVTGKNIAFLQKEFLRVLKNNKDSTFYFLQKVNELIIESTADSLKQENFYQNGVYYYKVDKNIDTSFYFFEKAIGLSKDSMTSKRELNYYYNLTKYYHQQKKYEDALYTLNRFKTILNEDKNLRELNYVYSYKSRIYEEMGNFDSAYYNNRKRIEFAKKDKDTLNYALALISEINFNFFKKRKFDISLTGVNELRRLKIDNPYLEYTINRSIAYFYLNFNKNKLANSYFSSALNSIKRDTFDQNKNEVVVIYNDLIENSINLKDFRYTEIYMDSILNYESYMSDYERKRYYLNKLELAFLTSKNYKSIRRQLDTMFVFLIKAKNKRINSKFSALEEANKKEKQLLVEKQKIEISNKNLKQKQLVLFSLMIFLVLVLTIFYLFYQQKKIKQSHDTLLMQQRLFRAQMNPHFTSNTLFAIQNLLKKDPVKTEQYMLKFSRLLRIVLENSTKDYVSIETEIEALEKYLDLQQLRFKNRFEYHINIDDTIEQDIIKIPPMLIQPFVENTIEHGFKNIDYKGEIIINLQLNEGFVVCIIKDNGVGFINKEKKIEVSSTVLIKSLIKKMTGTSVMISNIDNKGVKIIYKIPFKTEL